MKKFKIANKDTEVTNLYKILNEQIGKEYEVNYIEKNEFVHVSDSSVYVKLNINKKHQLQIDYELPKFLNIIYLIVLIPLLLIGLYHAFLVQSFIFLLVAIAFIFIYPPIVKIGYKGRLKAIEKAVLDKLISNKIIAK